MGPIGCPKTSVGNHHYLMHNSPEGSISHLHPGRSFKLWITADGL